MKKSSKVYKKQKPPKDEATGYYRLLQANPLNATPKSGPGATASTMTATPVRSIVTSKLTREDRVGLMVDVPTMKRILQRVGGPKSKPKPCALNQPGTGTSSSSKQNTPNSILDQPRLSEHNEAPAGSIHIRISKDVAKQMKISQDKKNTPSNKVAAATESATSAIPHEGEESEFGAPTHGQTPDPSGQSPGTPLEPTPQSFNRERFTRPAEPLIDFLYLEQKQAPPYSSVQIVGQDGYIYVHKILLAGFSKFLHGILQEDNSKRPMIILPDFRIASISKFMNLLYCGNIIVNKNELDEIISIGKQLGFQEMTICGKTTEDVISNDKLKFYIEAPASIAEADTIHNRSEETIEVEQSTSVLSIDTDFNSKFKSLPALRGFKPARKLPPVDNSLNSTINSAPEKSTEVSGPSGALRPKSAEVRANKKRHSTSLESSGVDLPSELATGSPSPVDKTTTANVQSSSCEGEPPSKKLAFDSKSASNPVQGNRKTDKGNTLNKEITKPVKKSRSIDKPGEGDQGSSDPTRIITVARSDLLPHAKKKRNYIDSVESSNGYTLENDNSAEDNLTKKMLTAKPRSKMSDTGKQRTENKQSETIEAIDTIDEMLISKEKALLSITTVVSIPSQNKGASQLPSFKDTNSICKKPRLDVNEFEDGFKITSAPHGTEVEAATTAESLSSHPVNTANISNGGLMLHSTPNDLTSTGVHTGNDNDNMVETARTSAPIPQPPTPTTEEVQQKSSGSVQTQDDFASVKLVITEHGCLMINDKTFETLVCEVNVPSYTLSEYLLLVPPVSGPPVEGRLRIRSEISRVKGLADTSSHRDDKQDSTNKKTSGIIPGKSSTRSGKQRFSTLGNPSMGQDQTAARYSYHQALLTCSYPGCNQKYRNINETKHCIQQHNKQRCWICLELLPREPAATSDSDRYIYKEHCMKSKHVVVLDGEDVTHCPLCDIPIPIYSVMSHILTNHLSGRETGPAPPTRTKTLTVEDQFSQIEAYSREIAQCRSGSDQAIEFRRETRSARKNPLDGRSRQARSKRQLALIEKEKEGRKVVEQATAPFSLGDVQKQRSLAVASAKEVYTQPAADALASETGKRRSSPAVLPAKADKEKEGEKVMEQGIASLGDVQEQRSLAVASGKEGDKQPAADALANETGKRRSSPAVLPAKADKEKEGEKVMEQGIASLGDVQEQRSLAVASGKEGDKQPAADALANETGKRRSSPAVLPAKADKEKEGEKVMEQGIASLGDVQEQRSLAVASGKEGDKQPAADALANETGKRRSSPAVLPAKADKEKEGKKVMEQGIASLGDVQEQRSLAVASGKEGDKQPAADALASETGKRRSSPAVLPAKADKEKEGEKVMEQGIASLGDVQEQRSLAVASGKEGDKQPAADALASETGKRRSSPAVLPAKADKEKEEEKVVEQGSASLGDVQVHRFLAVASGKGGDKQPAAGALANSANSRPAVMPGKTDEDKKRSAAKAFEEAAVNAKVVEAYVREKSVEAASKCYKRKTTSNMTKATTAAPLANAVLTPNSMQDQRQVPGLGKPVADGIPETSTSACNTGVPMESLQTNDGSYLNSESLQQPDQVPPREITASSEASATASNAPGTHRDILKGVLRTAPGTANDGADFPEDTVRPIKITWSNRICFSDKTVGTMRLIDDTLQPNNDSNDETEEGESGLDGPALTSEELGDLLSNTLQPSLVNKEPNIDGTGNPLITSGIVISEAKPSIGTLPDVVSEDNDTRQDRREAKINESGDIELNTVVPSTSTQGNTATNDMDKENDILGTLTTQAMSNCALPAPETGEKTAEQVVLQTTTGVSAQQPEGIEVITITEDNLYSCGSCSLLFEQMWLLDDHFCVGSNENI